MGEPMHGGHPDDLQIKDVSDLLGIPVPTIRSWELRYDFVRPTRTEGGHRRYSLGDVERLRALRDQVGRGHAVSDAIELLERTAPRAEHSPFIQRFLDAVQARDQIAMRAVLEEAREAFGLDEAIQRVLLPAMRDVGWRWQAGRCDVGTEHLATEAARGWLTRFRLVDQPRDVGTWIVLACGPRDFHTVGLECFAAMLGERGWNVQVLGAQTPVESLVRAAAADGTGAAVVLSHMPINRSAATEAIRALAHRVEVPIFYAGNAFVAARARRRLPGTYLGDDMVEAVALVERSATRRRVG